MSKHKLKLGEIVNHIGDIGRYAEHRGVIIERIARECTAGAQLSYLVKWSHGGINSSLATIPIEHNELELCKAKDLDE